jgi:hypothetical protein
MPWMKAKRTKQNRRAAKSRSHSTKSIKRSAKRAKPAKRGRIVTRKRKVAKKPKRVTTRRKKLATSKRAAVARRPRPKPPATPLSRRDGTGHLTPKYAADLRAMSRESAEPKDALSFVEGTKSKDPLAEELGEEFVQSAVSGEERGEEALDEVVCEERGGPFVVTPAGMEFAEGTDASNPKGSKREPFPTT